MGRAIAIGSPRRDPRADAARRTRQRAHPPAHDSGVDDGLDVAEMRARLKQKQQALMEKLATRKELQMELREAVARKHPELIASSKLQLAINGLVKYRCISLIFSNLAYFCFCSLPTNLTL